MKLDLVRFLSSMGRINPAIWDAIIPRYATSVGEVSKESWVELNPQPIPPGHELLFASARVAHEIAGAAIAAEASGNAEATARIVSRAVDDWCGNAPRHLPIPWPGPWPFPWPPDPEPHPEWEIGASRLVGALTLAGVASRLGEGEAQKALTNGAEQLLETALST